LRIWKFVTVQQHHENLQLQYAQYWLLLKAAQLLKNYILPLALYEWHRTPRQSCLAVSLIVAVAHLEACTHCMVQKGVARQHNYEIAK